MHRQPPSMIRGQGLPPRVDLGVEKSFQLPPAKLCDPAITYILQPLASRGAPAPIHIEFSTLSISPRQRHLRTRALIINLSAASPYSIAAECLWISSPRSLILAPSTQTILRVGHCGGDSPSYPKRDCSSQARRRATQRSAPSSRRLLAARLQPLLEPLVRLHGCMAAWPYGCMAAPNTAGRVNLIGEHIDYSGYGVLPMAIAQDTIVAIRPGGSSLIVTSLQPELYPDMKYSTDPKQDVDVQNHSWANYFICAYKGVHELLEARQDTLEPCGLQVLIHGIVPTGSGLSSSAAIICASMVAILAAGGKLSTESGITKAEVAAFAAKAEAGVGVSCGGMDQAISMMGAKGVAKKVEFNPVRSEDVVLPAGATFVIANSLAVSNKAVGAHRRYNMRVVECRLAAMVLALALGQEKQSVISGIKTLMDAEPAVTARYGPGSADQAARAVQEHLHEGRYSLEEIEGILGVPLKELYKESEVSLKVLDAGREDGGFLLRNRALHVYEEAQRVRAFKAACDKSGDGSGEDQLSELGGLMDASHASCSRLFECSCPELEELVTAAKASGALGARLTGAGWGGCTVSLVRAADAAAFISALKEKYYEPRVKAGLIQLDIANMSHVLFASGPSSGAAVMKISGLVAE